VTTSGGHSANAAAILGAVRVYVGRRAAQRRATALSRSTRFSSRRDGVPHLRERRELPVRENSFTLSTCYSLFSNTLQGLDKKTSPVASTVVYQRPAADEPGPGL